VDNAAASAFIKNTDRGNQLAFGSGFIAICNSGRKLLELSFIAALRAILRILLVSAIITRFLADLIFGMSSPPKKRYL
jgi:hypothetical protein